MGGTAAILAGVMRAVASLPLGAGDAERQLLYFVIDFLLLIGLMAVYAQHHQDLGFWGAAGFLIAVAGILLVRSSRAIPGFDLYPAGALAVVSGWVLLSATTWKRAHGPAFLPLLFAVSAVIGSVGQLTTRPAASSLVAGIVFGAAMIGVGRFTTRPPKRCPSDRPGEFP
jgi:hypothetical protein